MVNGSAIVSTLWRKQPCDSDPLYRRSEYTFADRFGAVNQGGLLFILLFVTEGDMNILTFLNSHLAPIKIDATSSLSMKSKVLYLGRKAKKNNVALSHIFLVSTGLYG
jgi:hypothetical protein